MDKKLLKVTTGYKFGLFDCLSNCVPCLVATCLSPGILLGIAEGARKNIGFDVLGCCCGGIAAYRLRRDVQQRYNIVEDEDVTMCSVGCCYCCTIIQDVSEVMHRGDLKLFGNNTAVAAVVSDPPKAMDMGKPQSVHPSV